MTSTGIPCSWQLLHKDWQGRTQGDRGSAATIYRMDIVTGPRAGGLVSSLVALSLSSTGAAAPPEAELNLERVDHALQDAHSTAELWHYSWIGIFGANLATRVTLGLALDDPDDRTVQWVGAAPVGLGLLAQIFMPLPALSLEDDLARIDALDGGVEAKRALLLRYAEGEARTRSWVAHVLGIGFNAAAAAWLLFGEDQPTAAALQLGIGALVSETRIWTSPQAASHALEGRSASRPSQSRGATGMAWSMTVGPGQFNVLVQF